jgi:hypothetical protein
MTYCVKNCSYFLKINNDNIESDTKIKTWQLGTGGESVKHLFTFGTPNYRPDNLL